MALTDNERVQEIGLVIGDKVAAVSKKWWYALLITIILAVPIYYAAKTGFVQLAMKHYVAPTLTYHDEPKQPLEIKETGIFDLGNNNYSGYAKITNLEHDWGVASLPISAVFKTFGGTVVGQMTFTTYILPSSEKLLVFSLPHPEKKPDTLEVTMGKMNFVQKPDIQFDCNAQISCTLQRITVSNPKDGLVVSASITNSSPFTITRVDLPVAVYDNNNKLVAVNYTYINDLKSGETRSFQEPWPAGVSGALRAEIGAQINIFDRNVFQLPTGGSSF